MAQPEPKRARVEVKPVAEHYWFVEAWHQFRPIWILFVVHAAILTLALGSLEFAIRLLGWSSLKDEFKPRLDKFDFYSNGVVLVIFAVSFIIKSLFIVYKELRNDGR